MTGADLVDILVTVVNLNTGSRFTALFDQNCWPTHLGEPTEEKLRDLAGAEVQHRLAPVNEALRQLIKLCLSSGVLWKHPECGWAIQTLQQLTVEEDRALQAVRTELKKVDTFISNPVWG